MNYYNDFEPYVCQWLNNLAQADKIPAGFVDYRSIQMVQASDLEGFTQAHFFAGLGGWSYALRLAGWPDDLPVWTGSCPCQPFSAAGKRGGTDDPRHLWPQWFRLIRECRPGVIFGEQVASKDGLNWLDVVSADLESAGYAVAAVDLCAAGAGAPHLRQRLFFVAHTNAAEWRSGAIGRSDDNPAQTGWDESTGSIGERGTPDLLAHADRGRRQQRNEGERAVPIPDEIGILGDANSERYEEPQSQGEAGRISGDRQPVEAGGFWSDLEWLPCRDGKARPTKPGLFPLANGIPRRVAKLRAIGNSIVVPLAAEFIKAYMELEQ